MFYESWEVLVKNVPLERWIQLMIGSFKKLNEIVVFGYTCLFVCLRAHNYDEGMHVLAGLHAENLRGPALRRRLCGVPRVLNVVLKLRSKY